MKRKVSVAPTAEKAAAVERNGLIVVSGPLVFDTVPDLYEQTRGWLERPGGAVSADLRAVSRADSAGLALFVEWLRLAKTTGRALTFINVPEQVHSLIRVNGLEEALGVK